MEVFEKIWGRGKHGSSRFPFQGVFKMASRQCVIADIGLFCTFNQKYGILKCIQIPQNYIDIVISLQMFKFCFRGFFSKWPPVGRLYYIYILSYTIQVYYCAVVVTMIGHGYKLQSAVQVTNKKNVYKYLLILIRSD